MGRLTGGQVLLALFLSERSLGANAIKLSRLIPLKVCTASYDGTKL